MKYRGKIAFTKEALEHFLGLPAGIELHITEHELDREIINFYLSSEEAVDQWTFPTGEGHAVQGTNMDVFEEAIEKQVVERFSVLTKYHDNEAFQQLLKRSDVDA